MASNTEQLKNALSAYLADITDAVILASAQVALDSYIDAVEAYSNISKSAAVTYSDARGSVSKRLADEARANRDRLWNDFVQMLVAGNVTPPSLTSSVGYWSMSGEVY